VMSISGPCIMLKADATFEAALSALSDVRLELEDLRMPKRMSIDEKDPEVGAEGIVRKAAVLGQHQIPSNINEYST
jgi:hypothetical protein